MASGCVRWTRVIASIVCALPIVVAGQGAVDLSGKWTLDTALSDSPEQIAAAIRTDLGQGGGEQVFGEAGTSGAFGGRGGGGRRGPDARAGTMRSSKPNAEEQK